MSALTGFKRRLKPNKVYVAQKLAEKKIEFAKQVVLDRAKRDAEFAADVLKAVDNLPQEIKDACKKSVDDAKAKELVEKWEKTGLLEGTGSNSSLSKAIIIESQEAPWIQDAPLGDGFVSVQSDGGEKIIVNETEVPGYPRNGQ